MGIRQVDAQRRIGTIWCSGAFVMLLAISALMISNRFGERSGELWQWFLTNVSPTTTLIVAAWVRSEQQGQKRIACVSIQFTNAVAAFTAISISVLMGILVGTAWYIRVEDKLALLNRLQVVVTFCNSLSALFYAVLFNAPTEQNAVHSAQLTGN